MRNWMVYVVAIAALGACGNDDDTKSKAGVCADVAGNWSITSVDAGGSTCPPSSSSGQAQTLAIQKRADGSYNVLFPGVEGGCSATLDGATCRLTANCGVAVNGQKAAEYLIEWTISGDTLSGSEVGRRFGSQPCTDNGKDTGKRL